MPISIERIGSFFIGGETVTLDGLPPVVVNVTADLPPLTVEQNGSFAAFQMYVHYVQLQHPVAKDPLLLWHGGSLTGAVWEDTPDGRPGWQMRFLESGRNVYVSDSVERGRASWARFPEIYPTAPIFRSQREAWDVFRLGPRLGEPFPGAQFPYEHFQTFAKSIVPRWTCNDEPTLAAYLALVDRIGPCTIVAHSHGAAFALEVALRKPQCVKAIVALEPSAVPRQDLNRVSTLRGIPHLFVWGDYAEDHWFWKGPVRASRAYSERIASAGVDTTFTLLPQRGIRGNTHMLMLDRNSDTVLAIVGEWLRRAASASAVPS